MTNKIKRQTAVFMVQQITNGVADIPILFNNEEQADEYYIKLVNEEYSQDFNNIAETLDFMSYERDEFHKIEKEKSL